MFLSSICSCGISIPTVERPYLTHEGIFDGEEFKEFLNLVEYGVYPYGSGSVRRGMGGLYRELSVRKISWGWVGRRVREAWGKHSSMARVGLTLIGSRRRFLLTNDSLVIQINIQFVLQII